MGEGDLFDSETSLFTENLLSLSRSLLLLCLESVRATADFNGSLGAAAASSLVGLLELSFFLSSLTGFELSFFVSSGALTTPSSSFGFLTGSSFLTSFSCSCSCSSPSWSVLPSQGTKFAPACFSIGCIPSLLRRRLRSGECKSFTSVTGGA